VGKIFSCNLNNAAIVRLTPAGEDAWREYWMRSRPDGVPDSIRASATLPDGRVRFQLHALFEIFGPLVYMGSRNLPFVDNEVTVETDS